jgi:hypothetical protein
LSESGSPTFARLCEASGLASTFAAGAMRRALQRAGVDPETLTPETRATALDSVRRALELFLPPQEAAERVAAVSRLTKARK